MKFRMVAILGALMLILSACSETTESGGEIKVDEGVNAQEVFEKSIEAQEDVKSFKMNADVTQTIGSGDDEMEMKSQIEADMVMEPMAFHQIIDMTANGEAMQMESYFTEEGFFTKQGDQWMKFPDEMTETLLSMQKSQIDPVQQMEMLKEYVDEFTLEEEEDTYIMTLKASGDKFQQLIDKAIQEMGAQNEMMQGSMDKMKVNEVAYTYSIDKENYLPVQFKMDMDSEMTMDSETVSMVMDLDSTYDQYNEIGDITIPEEVIENAEKMPGMEQ